MNTQKKKPNLLLYGIGALLLALLYPLYGSSIYIIWASILSLLFSLPDTATVGSGIIIGLTLLPHALPLLFCISGIIRGIRHIQTNKTARNCILLSSLGTLIYITMLGILFYFTMR